MVFNNFGKKNTGLDLFEFLKSVESLGVGEIFLQNINNDGSQTGFDLENIEKSVEATSLPLIACSGAGSSNHFVDVLKIKNISAVAAGNIFNYTERSYPRIKQEIKKYIKNVR